MEAVGTVSVGEWNSSFNGMCSDEADFMGQLLGSCSLPNAAAFWGGDESSVYPSSDETNATSMFSFVFPSSSQGSYFPSVSSSSLMAMDFCMMDGKNNAMEADVFLNQDASIDSDASDEKLHHPLQEDRTSSKRRARVLGESQRSKELKRSVKVDENENDNVLLHRQSCCSEDESNASHEANGLNSSSSAKRTRASRGSATDPQSLYARKRRERINERLKVLQSLVPNGTKVDISTMLEEAVQYVKFLQLQIKLLSSDDMWMYAPIAYNGMDIGLDFKIPSPKPQP